VNWKLEIGKLEIGVLGKFGIGFTGKKSYFLKK